MRLRRRDEPNLRVSVNNRRCHQYGVCEAEASNVFQLATDGRLHYETLPPAAEHDRVLMAARCCPMQAIAIEELTK